MFLSHETSSHLHLGSRSLVMSSLLAKIFRTEDQDLTGLAYFCMTGLILWSCTDRTGLQSGPWS